MCLNVLGFLPLGALNELQNASFSASVRTREGGEGGLLGGNLLSIVGGMGSGVDG